MEPLNPYRLEQVTVDRDQSDVDWYSVHNTAYVTVRMDRELTEIEKQKIARAFDGYAGKNHTMADLKFGPIEVKFRTTNGSDASMFVGYMASHAEELAQEATVELNRASNFLKSLEDDLRKFEAPTE
ncbi:hypothetical protein DFO66_10713 [Brevibacterium sanguinis]|uniref:Uncharacterized protein n=2 Tax=Brevibacterium TaxID=1696 RepID=A0A366IIX8_9MICO|nr:MULTISPECIES: hypothetical protein [Brevibacterium]RBP64141.1 hypothetical protein DFO66_10713 [Brevibacterium sanguinis]RBP71567.1 hypothetical protein DFO65_105171 [Brevibacterium celere]